MLDTKDHANALQLETTGAEGEKKEDEAAAAQEVATEEVKPAEE